MIDSEISGLYRITTDKA